MSILLISIILLVLLSAFFSASETAYTSLNRNRIKSLAEHGSRMAALVLKLDADFDQLLSTILVGNNIVNIAAASLCSMMCIRYYSSLGLTIPTALLTIDILFFGEITPKSLAREYPERFAIFAAVPLLCFRTILWPANIIFTLWKRFLSKTLKFKNDTKISQEELLLMVDEAQHEGGIDKDESTLLKNAIKFTDCRVEEILTHRVDIAAIPLTASRTEIAEKFTQTKYSRLVVYSENLDNIVGVLVLKDFYGSEHQNSWRLQDNLTPPCLIQKTEKIDDVLKHLQRTCSQIAIVLDEFGGTLGMVSMEDIIEELVGEIWDEHDEVEEKFKQTGDHAYRVAGTVALDDFQEFFGVKLVSKETILSGWVLEQLSGVPQKGDHFTYQTLDITIASCSRHRIRQLAIQKHETPENSPETEENDNSAEDNQVK